MAGRDADRTVRPEDKHPSYLPRNRIMNFKKWFDVPVLEVDLTRMPNLKQALTG